MKFRGPSLLILACILAGVCFLSLVGVFWFMHESDIAPPDLSEFEVVRPTIPGATDEQSELTSDKNAYSHFLAAAQAISDETLAVLESQGGSPLALEAEAMERLVVKNRPVFDSVAKGILCDICLSPRKTSLIGGAQTDLLARYAEEIRVLFSMKAMIECDEKDYDAALESSRILLEFGELYQSCSDVMTDWSPRDTPIRAALWGMIHLAQCADLPDIILVSLAEILAGPNGINDRFDHAVRSDFMLEAKTLESFPELIVKQRIVLGRYSQEEIFGGRQRGVQRLVSNAVYSAACQPNRTKALLAEIYREILGGLPGSYAQLSFVVLQKTKSLQLSDGSLVRAVLEGNMMGEILFRNITRTLRFCLDQKYRSDVDWIGTRLVVACIRYERKHGQLPASLQDLVPEFLDEIPADPFDGKPIRYDKTEGIVYSVGTDLVDSGGTMDPSRIQPPRPDLQGDLVFPIH